MISRKYEIGQELYCKKYELTCVVVGYGSDYADDSYIVTFDKFKGLLREVLDIGFLTSFPLTRFIMLEKYPCFDKTVRINLFS